jgi:hypothetical protein
MRAHVARAPRSTNTLRNALAEHLKRFHEFGVRWNVGSALIVPNPWLRGLVTAVTWLSPPKFPYRLCSEPIEAERWAKKQLAAKLAEEAVPAKKGSCELQGRGVEMHMADTTAVPGCAVSRHA